VLKRKGLGAYLTVTLWVTTEVPVYSLACVALAPARLVKTIRAARAEKVLDGFMASVPPPIADTTRTAPPSNARDLQISGSRIECAAHGSHRQKPAFNPGGTRTIRQRRLFAAWRGYRQR
jgi:hypothetical protein